MSSKDRSMDSLIKEAIADELAETPAPPVSKAETWERIRAELFREAESLPAKRGVFRRRSFKIGAAVLLAFMVFAATLPTQNGYALGWITKYFARVQGNVTQLLFNTAEPASPRKGAAPPPPPDIQVHTPSMRQEQLSLAEAQKKTKFTIVTPQALPDHFALQYVKVTTYDGKPSTEIELVYSDGSGMLRLREQMMEGESHVTVGVDNEDTKVKEVTVQGLQGTLLLFKDGSNQLIWYKADMQFTINSRLSEADVLKVAQSM